MAEEKKDHLKDLHKTLENVDEAKRQVDGVGMFDLSGLSDACRKLEKTRLPVINAWINASGHASSNGEHHLILDNLGGCSS